MEELLRKLFKAFPDKSTIIFKGRCFDCDNTVKINITPTSEGFGLLGGAFIEYSRSEYVAKCPDCYKFNSEIFEPYKAFPNVLSIYNKQNLLDSISKHENEEGAMWHSSVLG